MNKFYPFEHWVVTILIGPLLLVPYELIRSSYQDAIGALEMFLLYLVFGLVYSLPDLIAYYFAYKTIIKRLNSERLIKTILNCIAIIGVVLTFLLIRGSLAVTLAIAYSIAVVISSLFPKLRNDTEMPITSG